MKTVAIIGAGPAGLTCAYELLYNAKGEYKVVILEESDAIGGISRTIRYNGMRMDIGGHRFFSKDERVTAWWNQQLPLQGSPAKDDRILGREKAYAPAGPDPETEDQVMLLRDRVSRIYFNKHFFDYPVSLSMNTLKGMGFLTTMEVGFSYLASLMHKRPESSLENFYINRFGRKLYSMFFEGYTEKLWGRHPRDIAADWGAQRVKGLSVSAILKDIFGKIFHPGAREVETSLIEQFVYPKYGPGQLWELVADKITEKGGTIRKNCRVTGLHTAGNQVVSLSYEQAGVQESVTADIVISSMPVKDLISSLGTAVPDSIGEIAEGLPYRDFVTVGLLVPKLNLKNTTPHKTLGNIVPDCWIYVQDPFVKLGRIQIFNNWSPYMLPAPEDTVWVGLEYFCSEGDELWTKSPEDMIAFAASELEALGVIEKREVLDAHCAQIKKAYPAYFDTYSEIDTLVDYLNGFENLYCIGRNGQHRYNNMDHSMVTAFETVRCIEEGSTDKSAIWNVNTEKSYHEKSKGVYHT